MTINRGNSSQFLKNVKVFIKSLKNQFFHLSLYHFQFKRYNQYHVSTILDNQQKQREFFSQYFSKFIHIKKLSKQKQTILNSLSFIFLQQPTKINKQSLQYFLKKQLMLLSFKNIFKMSFTYPCPRKLRQVMKMSMIQRQPTHQIRNIWDQYHAPRISNTSSIMEKDMFLHIKEKASKAPMFLLPIHRGNGHFKLITQWQDGCFLGTYLEDYKRHGSKAQPYIVFTLFTELLFKKGVVLVRGDIINNSMNKPQAIKLWSMIEQAYTQQSRYEIVDHFNNATHNFNEKKYNEMYQI